MIKQTFLLLLFLAFIHYSRAQVSFEKVLCTHHDHDDVYKMIEDDEGNFILAGNWWFDDSQNPNNSWNGATLLKLNSYGERLWDSSYDDSYTTFYDIIQPRNTSTGYYLGGFGVNAFESSPRLSFITKSKQVIFDSIQDLPPINTGFVASMCVNYKEGLIVSSAAGTPYYMNSKECLYVQANTMTGKRLWYKHICLENMGGLRIFWNELLNQYTILCRGDNEFQFYVACLDSTGNVKEIKQPFKGFKSVYLHDAIQLKNGSYLVTLQSQSDFNPDGPFGAYCALLSPTGDSLSLKALSLFPDENPGMLAYHHLALCRDGGFIFAGVEKLVRTDSVFNILWVKNIPDAEFVSVCETKDGGYAAAGTIYVDNNTCIYFIKTDSLGQVLGIKETPVQKPIIRIYPNPADDNINIESSMHFSALTLTNVMGQTVLQLTEEVSSFNSSALPSGMYFITLLSANGSILHQQKLNILH